MSRCGLSKLVSIIFTFVIVSLSMGTTWQKTYGGIYSDLATCVQKTFDGAYILVGWTYLEEGNTDLYVLKVDTKGNLIWEKNFGGVGEDFARCVRQTSDGGYILVGTTSQPDTGTYDAYILKLDREGNMVWYKTLGGTNDDRANCVQQTFDGGYIIAGATMSFGEGLEDLYIVKIDERGNIMWQRTFGGSDWDWAEFIQQTPDGGYIVAGVTSSLGTNSEDVYILKLDAQGNKVWEQTFGGKGFDRAYCVQRTTDGGYVVAGQTESYGEGADDLYILKLDANGNLLWQRTYGGKGIDCAFSIRQTLDGGYIVAGCTESFAVGGFDLYLVKIDENGNALWQKTYGGLYDDWAECMDLTLDGGYIVVGGTNSLDMIFEDIYIIKLDSEGNTGPYPER